MSPQPPTAQVRQGVLRACTGAGFTGAAFTEMMLTDLIPMIEDIPCASRARESRDGGLSMGGMQTFLTTLANLDKFAYIGGFSGSTGGRGIRPEDVKQRRVRRRCGVQQESEGALPRNRFGRRSRHEELQRGTDKSRHSQRLLRISGHGSRVADLAAMPEGFRSSAFSASNCVNCSQWAVAEP